MLVCLLAHSWVTDRGSAQSVEEIVVLGDLEELDELRFEEGQFTIDLVHSPRVAISGVVRVVTNLLKSLPGRPNRVRLGIRLGIGLRIGLRIRLRIGLRLRVRC